MELLRGVIEKKVIIGKKREFKGFHQIFPFNTNVNKAKTDEVFKEHWISEFASFSRLISGFKAEYWGENQGLDFEPILNEMNIEVRDHDEFTSLLKELLTTGETKQQLQHPSMLLYLESTDIKGRVFKISDYLYDLCKENTELKDLFKINEQNNILQNIFSELKPTLEPSDKKSSSFDHKLPWIGDLFANDLLFLRNHPDFFIKYADLVVYYYTFFLLSQNVLKLSLLDHADYTKNNVESLYFTFDWESNVASRRDAVRKGFKYLEEMSNKLFSTQLTLAQLSCNTENIESQTMMDFPTIKSLFDQLSNQDKVHWLQDIDRQTNSIIESSKLQHKIKKSQTFSDSIKQLIYAMEISSHTSAQQRYGSGITEVAKVRLVKQRGRNGNVLSINQEILTMFLVVIIRSSKMRLQDVYIELEKRGIFLDRYSRIEFENTLEKMNLLIKMSDSGEAQYVKSIL
ncbi:DNA phosphorothioation-dependent restriction protein DptG [Exiguobacterium sp. R-39]|uniref:DNA phosphorothioation-dependent restriction protein DptG n=1 Tax=Exiguobacterium sp. R-39 TaxID=3416708 RepID=UPI003CF514BA